MNKYQEAYNYLLGLLELEDDIRWPLVKESINKFKELVDKATPKKVVLHYKHHLGTAWGTFVSRITCPSCNRRLKDKIPNNQLFCPKCGQALDWSDEDDK